MYTTQLVGKHLASFSKSLCLTADSSDLVGHRPGEGVIERQRKEREVDMGEREREKKEGTEGKRGDRRREETRVGTIGK